MSIDLRLHAAQRSKNLQSIAHQTTQIDLIAASGIASRTNRIGAAAFRTLEDQRFAPELIRLVSSAVIGKARSQHWRIKRREELLAFTAAVGAFWLKPYCTHCEGRGVAVVGQLARDICPHCQGTGTRPLPTAKDIGLHDRVDEVRFQRYVREALLCLDGQINGYLGKTRSLLG